MKKIINRFMNWVKCTFFTVHYVYSYKSEKLEYQVVSEIVTDKAIIDKANLVLRDAAA